MFKELTLEVFRNNTGINNGHLPREGLVVSLRHLAKNAKVKMVMAMEKEYLEKMLRRVVLAGDPSAYPYATSPITVERIAPLGFQIIQTFIQRSKYQDFTERFDQVFANFHVSHGVAKKMPMIVVGEDARGQTLVAHYLPPIVEIGPGMVYLPDGIHRCYLAGKVGTTIEAVIIKDVMVPPRAKLLDWSTVKVVDAKPPPAKRSVDNNPALYRLWEDVGIDG